MSASGSRNAFKNDFTSFSQIKACYGPISRSVNDMKLTLEVMFHPKINHYDPFVPPVPFRNEVYERAK